MPQSLAPQVRGRDADLRCDGIRREAATRNNQIVPEGTLLMG